MTINFPSSPALGGQYTYGMRAWKWNGTVWVSVVSSVINLPSGTFILPASYSLTLANSVWEYFGLSVTLPEAGKYNLDASLRVGFGESVAGGYMVTKLVDVTAGVDVPGAEVLNVYNVVAGVVNQPVTSILTTYYVSQPTVIRAHAYRLLAGGTHLMSAFLTGASGNTSLRYLKTGNTP
jgi:hypothetical protein